MGARLPVGIVLLLFGMLLGGYASCSRTWFRETEPATRSTSGDARQVDIGLTTYRICHGTRCESGHPSILFASRPEEQELEDRSQVFTSMGAVALSFFWLSAGPALWALVQLLRRRRPTAMWAVPPLQLVSAIAGMIMIGMLPLHLREVEPARVSFGPYLQWIAYGIVIVAAVLLLPRRRPAPAEPEGMDVKL